MIRTAHVLLLIATLLACPFQCAGLVGADVIETPSCSCCVSCCEVLSLPLNEAGPIQHSQDPLTPSGECTCSNCLCKGAVLIEDDWIHDTPIAGLWVVDVLPQINSPDAGDLAAGYVAPSVVSGHSLRLILQSLQI